VGDTARIVRRTLRIALSNRGGCGKNEIDESTNGQSRDEFDNSTIRQSHAMESPDATRSLKFGAFELDVRLRELRNGSTRIRLQEQPFEILRLMLERPGDIVTREQLRQRLWPEGTYVDFEHSLNAAVKRLRAALGDDAEHPRFVETLPRR
jgi:DNA-binding response OmpR family regulator